jgi:hypothetical protein
MSGISTTGSGAVRLILAETESPVDGPAVVTVADYNDLIAQAGDNFDPRLGQFILSTPLGMK